MGIQLTLELKHVWLALKASHLAKSTLLKLNEWDCSRESLKKKKELVDATKLAITHKLIDYIFKIFCF